MRSFNSLFYFSKHELLNKSARFAIFMLNVDEMLSPFRECFQKMENDLGSCRIRCHMFKIP